MEGNVVDLGGRQTTVVITGAAGFLGQWFLRYHKEAGHLVYACDDFSNSKELPDVVIPRADAADFLTRIDGPIDIAYHFAAPVGGRTKIEGDPLFNADSLRLDAAFFRWAVGRVGIAVYPSSSAVYGTRFQDVDAERPLRETLLRFDYGEDIPMPDEMYGFTKLAGEMLAWKAQRYGLNTLCIRPFSGYGEGQGMEYPIPSILARAKRREDPLRVWGSGRQKRDFVHVSDLVAATTKRLDAGVRGYQAMNIASGVGVSFLQIAGLAAELVGYHPAIEATPGRPVGVANRIGDPTEMERFYRPNVGLRDGLQRVLDALDA